VGVTEFDCRLLDHLPRRHLARFLGRTPKAIRAAVTRKQLPPPIRLAGRLAWRAPDVLAFVAELHPADNVRAEDALRYVFGAMRAAAAGELAAR